MTHRRRSIPLALAALILAAAALPLAAVAQSVHRLTEQDVVKLLQGQVSPHRVGQRAREQGIDFQVTPQVEMELRRAGATEELLTTLRAVVPVPQPARILVHTSPQAEVYVDDEYRGRASAEGRLVIGEAKPGAHILRVSLAGKKDFRESLNLPEGQQSSVDAVLSDVEMPAPKLVLPPTDGVYVVGGPIIAPVPVYKPDPPYSEQARKKKFQGTVVLSLVVGADGTVRDVKVIKALGMGLDEKAVETVQTWKFKPGTRNGIPVSVRVMTEVMFRLF